MSLPVLQFSHAPSGQLRVRVAQARVQPSNEGLRIRSYSICLPEYSFGICRESMQFSPPNPAPHRAKPDELRIRGQYRQRARSAAVCGKAAAEQLVAGGR